MNSGADEAQALWKSRSESGAYSQPILPYFLSDNLCCKLIKSQKKEKIPLKLFQIYHRNINVGLAPHKPLFPEILTPTKLYG